MKKLFSFLLKAYEENPTRTMMTTVIVIWSAVLWWHSRQWEHDRDERFATANYRGSSW